MPATPPGLIRPLIDSRVLLFEVSPPASWARFNPHSQADGSISAPQRLRSTGLYAACWPSVCKTAEVCLSFCTPHTSLYVMGNRTKVFICYSHYDKQWFERVQVHLKPMERDGLIERCDDSRIAAGNRWRDDLQRFLDESRVAVLLISADFLASDFITENELPPLLAAAEKEGLVILCVHLSASRFSDTPLEQFQSVNDPRRPLVKLRRGNQEDVLVKLTKDIENARADLAASFRTSVEDKAVSINLENMTFSEQDIYMIIEQWVVSHREQMHGQLIRYTDVDEKSDLPVGSAKKHLENAAKSQGYVVAQKSDLFIRFKPERLKVRF